MLQCARMFDPSPGDVRPKTGNSLAVTKPHVPADPARKRLPGLAILLGLALGLSSAIYLLAPFRTNLLILGVDRRPEQSPAASRSDTLILLTFIPLQPYAGMLSIPRDLWVEIPGFGPNRINAAVFLAEAARPGHGPRAAIETVRSNFGVDVDAYLSIEFSGFVRFVDALGGVDIDLVSATGGYAIGRHHLDGPQALAFVRDREGTDDFFRMERGQIIVARPGGHGRFLSHGTGTNHRSLPDPGLPPTQNVAALAVSAGDAGLRSQDGSADLGVAAARFGSRARRIEWGRRARHRARHGQRFHDRRRSTSAPPGLESNQFGPPWHVWSVTERTRRRP